MPAPKKCSVSGAYSLYSEDNLKKLMDDFSKLSSEIERDNQHPFQECSKRFERECEQVKDDQRNGYNDSYNSSDETSIKFRFQFFNRTLCPILSDPSKIETDIPRSSSSRTSPEKDDIENHSVWRKQGYAKEYFNSLLDRYDSERRDMSDNKKTKKNKYNSYYSHNDEQKTLSFDANHEKFIKEYESDIEKDFKSGGIMSSLWMNFDQSISNVRLDNVVPNTPIMSGEGLDSLFTLIKDIGEKIYHKNKVKILSSTYAFLKKYTNPLSEFFRDRVTYLTTFKSIDGNKNQKDDDSVENKEGLSLADDYAQKKAGYARVADNFLKLLMNSMKSDFNTIQRQSDDEAGGGQKGVFANLMNLLKYSKNEYNEEEQNPKENGVQQCLLKLISKANSEHKKLSEFQKRIAQDQDSENTNDDLEDQKSDNEDNRHEDSVNNNIYNFISNLTISSVGDKNNRNNINYVGKKFISLRACFRLLNDALDPKFNSIYNDQSNNENNNVNKKLKEVTESRKPVKDALSRLDVKKLGINDASSIVDVLSNKKEMSEFKTKIENIVDELSVTLNNCVEKIKNNNDKFKKCKDLFNQLQCYNKNADQINANIPNDISEFNNTNIKSYISFSDKDYKNFFDKDLKTLKLPDAKQHAKQLSLKLIKEIDDNQKTKGKGQEYLKYHAILSFAYNFFNINKSNNKNKGHIEYRESILESIKGVMSEENESFPENQQIFNDDNIFDIMYDYDKKEEVKSKISELVDVNYESMVSRIKFLLEEKHEYYKSVKKNNNKWELEVDESKRAESNEYFSNEFTEASKMINNIETKVKNINSVDAFNKLEEKIRPYVIYDKKLMDKEEQRIKKERSEYLEKTKLDENKKKFSGLSNDQKLLLMKRAQVGFLYLFFQTNPFKENQLFMSSIKKKKYDTEQRHKISDIEDLLIKFNVDKITSNQIEDSDLYKKLKSKLDDILKDTEIKKQWDAVLTSLSLNDKEETKKLSESYKQLVNEYKKVQDNNDNNVIDNNNLDKFVFFSKSDWDSEISAYNNKIDEYKKDKQIQDKFEAKQKSLQTEDEKNKQDTYKELIKQPEVKSYLVAKIRLNLVKIYLETNLLGMDYPIDKKLRETIDSTKNLYMNKINDLNLNDQKSVYDIYDILNHPAFEKKAIDNNLPEEEKKKAKEEQDRKEKAYKDENEKKKELLLKKYSTIGDSANHIINNLINTKSEWFNNNLNNNKRNGFKISDDNVKYLRSKNYPIYEGLEKILQGDLSEKEISNIIENKYNNNVSGELLKNCMSYNEEDFKKELENAKKIQKDRQI